MGRGGGSHSSSSVSRSSGSSHSRSFGGSSSHAYRGGGISRGSSSSSIKRNNLNSFRNSGSNSHRGSGTNLFENSSRSTSHYNKGVHVSNRRTNQVISPRSSIPPRSSRSFVPPVPPPPPRRRYSNQSYGNSSIKISSILITIIVLFMMLSMFISALHTNGSSGNTTKDTIKRERLEAYAPFNKDCIDDDAGWIIDKKTLLSGMEDFYNETGVQPALAIYEEIDGNKYLSTAEIEDFMYDKYDELIEHEIGILLLFCEYEESDYYVYYMVGEDAQIVMDNEACDVLIDFVHDLYISDYSDEEYFAAVFKKTAERIMTVTPTEAGR